MKLWRRIVSVLAGTMIAAGGVLGGVALYEQGAFGSAPPGGVQNPHAPIPVTLDADAARNAIAADTSAYNAWLSARAQSGDPPTTSDRFTAAIGALALSEITGGVSAPTPPNSTTLPPPEASAVGRLDAAVDGDAWQTYNSSLLVLSNASAGSGSPAGDLGDVAAEVTVALDGIAFSDTVTLSAAEPSYTSAYTRDALFTARGVTDAETASQPTDLVGLTASASDPPAPVANWTLSAEEELRARFDSGALESDTLNVSLASQAMRDERPSVSDALNAELRFRQGADGSFGSVRETAEAARALARGTDDLDRAAAVRALNWLDARGQLPAELAVLRLRAHAFDAGLVVQPPLVNETAPAAGGPPMGQGSGGGSAAFATSQGGIGLGTLSLWLLAGGIGLSLSLVTVDALKGSRQRLYDTIRASPGLHVNELRRRLHMSPSSIEYHLAVLMGAGLVVAEDDGRYRRYYANGAGLGLNPRSPNSRNALGALRRPHAVTLVRALLGRGAGATARELSRSLAIHESAVSRRLAHLEDAGLLSSDRQGRARVFRVRDPLAAQKALTAVEEAPPVVAAGPALDEGMAQATGQTVAAPAPTR